MARPKLFTKAEDMQKLIDAYYADCDEREMPYTIEGLAVACDCDRKTILNYSKDSEFFPTIKKARDKILARLAELAISGKGNPASIIFNLKNNYDYTDKQEIKQEIQQSVQYYAPKKDESL